MWLLSYQKADPGEQKSKVFRVSLAFQTHIRRHLSNFLCSGMCFLLFTAKAQLQLSEMGRVYSTVHISVEVSTLSAHDSLGLPVASVGEVASFESVSSVSCYDGYSRQVFFNHDCR